MSRSGIALSSGAPSSTEAVLASGGRSMPTIHGAPPARVPAAQIAHARAVLLALAALSDDSTEDSL